MGKDWCSSLSVLSSTAPSLRSWSPWLGIGWREPVGPSSRTKDDILWFQKEFFPKGCFFHASLPRHFVSIYFFCRASSLPRCSALSSSDLTNDALKCAESPSLAPCSGVDIPLFFPLPFLPFPFPWTNHQSRNKFQLDSIGLFRYSCLPPRLTLPRISPEEVFPSLGDRVCIEHFLGQCHITTIFTRQHIVKYNERTNNIPGTSHTKHAWHNNIYRCTTKSTAKFKASYIPETNSTSSTIFH